MGLDISIETNNSKEIHSDGYFDEKNDYFNKHSLSRTFCNLMCRKNVIDGEPELDQIGKITSVDISPITEMESFGLENNEELDFYLDTAENEEERNKILQQAKSNQGKLLGNIDKVSLTIENLLFKLSTIDNLPELLDDNGNDTLNNKKYFSEFNVDKGKGYIDNNFGQDLRNFKRFLEYAKSKGTTTVYFNYG